MWEEKLLGEKKDMARKKSRKSPQAARPKAGRAWRKQALVGLAIVVVVVAVVLGLAYYRQMGAKNEADLYARGPVNASVVLREFGSFT